MAYLTYEEYTALAITPVSATDFPQLLAKASDVLDSVTRAFYQFNDMALDVPFRRDHFKKAVVAQIDYFSDMGGTSSHELNSPLSVTIGRTQMSSGESNQKKLNTIVSDDVYMLLRHTGLLYRGLC